MNPSKQIRKRRFTYQDSTKVEDNIKAIHGAADALGITRDELMDGEIEPILLTFGGYDAPDEVWIVSEYLKQDTNSGELESEDTEEV